MQTKQLRNELMGSLEQILKLEAFSALDDYLQGETLVLHCLGMQCCPLCPSDLIGVLHLSRSRITAAVAALRRKGLVETRASEADRRRVEVTITAEGRKIIAEKRQRLHAYFDRLVDGLGEEETHRLIGLIGRCAEVMEE